MTTGELRHKIAERIHAHWRPPAPVPDPSPRSPFARLWRWFEDDIPPWVGFTLPLVCAFVPVILFAIFFPGLFGTIWSFAWLVPFAMDFAIVIGLGLNLKWHVVWAVTLWVQFFALVWFARNIDLLRRWDRFDKFVRRQEVRARSIYDRHHWVRKFHYTALVVFVFLPFSSGIIAGFLLGKLTGMHTRIALGAVFLGTVLWVSFLVWAGGYSVEWLQDQWNRVF